MIGWIHGCGICRANCTWFVFDESKIKLKGLDFRGIHNSTETDNKRQPEIGLLYRYMCAKVLVVQLCPVLCNPIDCSLLGSSVHEILQPRILEWVAMSFSRRSSQSRNQTHLFCFPHWQVSSFPLGHLGRPYKCIFVSKLIKLYTFFHTSIIPQ